MRSKRQFVVLGAGYAGMTVAVHLDNKLSEKNFQVILVNINAYHELVQDAHLVAGGFRSPEQVRIPISALIRETGIRFLQSGVGAADSTLLQINEAEETLLASHNRSIKGVP